MLLGCLSVPRWADVVLAGQPYDDRDALIAAADAAARALTDEELDQALSGHPRIGERGGAPSRSGSSPASTPTRGDTAARLKAGNAAYEERFGRVFLIRAAGRDAEEILSQLERRLRNDDATERAETVDNLRQIALLRLEAAPVSPLSTHVLDTAAGRPARRIAGRLETRDGEFLGEGVTDDDGRVGAIGPERLEPGTTCSASTPASTSTASTPRWSWCSRSPTRTSTTTCRCS